MEGLVFIKTAEIGCKLYDSDKSWDLTIWFDTECLKRHRKKCKFGDTYIYQSNCSYKHSFVNEKKEIDAERKEVNQLNSEIEELLRDNECNVNTLAKEHFKDLEDIRNKNSVLRNTLTESVEYTTYRKTEI